MLRIQRDKPPGRCTATCFRDRKCHFLLNLGRTPPDAELFRWLFEVEAVTADHSQEESNALAAEHTSIAKARWSAPARKTAPKGKAKAAQAKPRPWPNHITLWFASPATCLRHIPLDLVGRLRCGCTYRKMSAPCIICRLEPHNTRHGSGLCFTKCPGSRSIPRLSHAQPRPSHCQ